jgi:hypothetical protein
VCELCQRLVNVGELYESDVEGLRGRRICIYHGDLGTALSRNDLRGVDDTLRIAITETVREEPYGDTPWWDVNGLGYLTQVNGQYIHQVDGLTGLGLVD